MTENAAAWSIPFKRASNKESNGCQPFPPEATFLPSNILGDPHALRMGLYIGPILTLSPKAHETQDYLRSHKTFQMSWWPFAKHFWALLSCALWNRSPKEEPENTKRRADMLLASAVAHGNLCSSECPVTAEASIAAALPPALSGSSFVNPLE